MNKRKTVAIPALQKSLSDLAIEKRSELVAAKSKVILALAPHQHSDKIG